MSDMHIIETIFEGAMILLIIFGFIFEDKLVNFEQRIFRKIRRAFMRKIAKRADVIDLAPYMHESRRAAR